VTTLELHKTDKSYQKYAVSHIWMSQT